MLKVYMPSLPLTFVSRQLGFDDDADAAFFLGDHGVVLEGEGEEAKVDCKVAAPQCSNRGTAEARSRRRVFKRAAACLEPAAAAAQLAAAPKF